MENSKSDIASAISSSLPSENPPTSFLSSNFDNLEAARAKAAESVINVDQFFPDINGEIKVYSDKFSLLGDNSDELNDEETKFQNVVEKVEEEYSMISTESTRDADFNAAINFLPTSWTTPTAYALPNIRQIMDTRASELYASGMIALKSGNLMEALASFSHCIHLKPNEPSYFANRAEVFLHLTDFQSAILNYKRACILDPDNREFFDRLTFLYVFQSQTLFDQGMHAAALEAVGRAIEMHPDNPSYQTRAIACLAAMNRHSECLALIDKQIDADGGTNADFFILRAKLHATFRNFTLCYYDLIDALKIDPAHEEAKRVLQRMADEADVLKCQSVEMGLLGRLHEAINKISLAIELNPIIGDFHVKRGAFLRRMKNFTSAIDDFLMAMDKVDHNEEHETHQLAQRQLVLTFNDFAVQCFFRGYFTEALTLLNKAIQSDKSESAFYINRGDCFYKLKQWDFALADYEQAAAMTENCGQTARCRMALVHFSVAQQAFSAERYADAEQALGRALCNNAFQSVFWNTRARTRYLLENFRGARIDLICGIFLAGFDRSIESTFNRLFPGKTIAQVMESALAARAKKEFIQISAGQTQTHADTVVQKNVLSLPIGSAVGDEHYDGEAEQKQILKSLAECRLVEQQIKKSSERKNYLKNNNGAVRRSSVADIVLPDNPTLVQRIVGRKDGSKYFMDNKGSLVKIIEAKGWRKFRTGIEKT